MGNKTIIGIVIAAGIIIALMAYSKNKVKKPCPCLLMDQNSLINKLTEAELKESILAMDSAIDTGRKSITELRNILKELIDKNK